jgi:hypothetical protein
VEHAAKYLAKVIAGGDFFCALCRADHAAT